MFRCFDKRFESVAGLEDQIGSLSIIARVDEIDLVFEQIEEDLVAELRAADAFGHFRFNVEHHRVCF